MIELIAAVSRAELLFDKDRLEQVYGYIPCYDRVLKAVQRSGVRMENRDGSHFGWWAEVSQDQVDRFMKRYFREFLKHD